MTSVKRYAVDAWFDNSYEPTTTTYARRCQARDLGRQMDDEMIRKSPNKPLEAQGTFRVYKITKENVRWVTRNDFPAVVTNVPAECLGSVGPDPSVLAAVARADAEIAKYDAMAEAAARPDFN